MGIERLEFIWDEERGELVQVFFEPGPGQGEVEVKEEKKEKKIKSPYVNGGRAKKARCRWHNHRR